MVFQAETEAKHFLLNWAPGLFLEEGPQDRGGGREDELVSSEGLGGGGAVRGVRDESDVEEGVGRISEIAEVEVDVEGLAGVVAAAAVG